MHCNYKHKHEGYTQEQINRLTDFKTTLKYCQVFHVDGEPGFIRRNLLCITTHSYCKKYCPGIHNLHWREPGSKGVNQIQNAKFLL